MTSRNAYRRLTRVALAAGTAAVLLSGCALLEGPTPDTPTRVTPAVPEAPPELIPGGTAEENLPYFTEVIRGYAAGEGAVNGEPIVNAVAESGFDRSAMQVSFDATKTGLEADNIFVSVRVDDACLIGQITAPDRDFATSVEPAVGPDRNICLIGETRVIDW